MHSKGVQYLEIPDGEMYLEEMENSLSRLRAAIDESVVLLPMSLISKGDAFRSNLIMVSKHSLRGQDGAEAIAANMIQALSQFRSDVIVIARTELLGEAK